MEIRFKKLDPSAIIPRYEHEFDSGFDFCALEACHIEPGKVVSVRTGLAMELPPPSKLLCFPVGDLLLTFELQIRPKSGNSLKKGFSVFNTPGTIDNGYRNEILILLYTLPDRDVYIEVGDKIAQGVICPVITAPSVEVREVMGLSIPLSSRGLGGFGSTGEKYE